MKKLLQTTIGGLLFTCLFSNVSSQTLDSTATEVLKYAELQLERSVADIALSTKHPRRNYADNSWVTVGRTDWTSGFWSGCLWLMYKWSEKTDWSVNAVKWTADLESVKNDTTTHDIGFQIMNSYGNGDRLMPSESYKAVILKAAQSLSTRFNVNAGSIISWNKASWHPFNKPVIIDNIMNLELLFYASRISGDSSFYKIAVKHADKTLVTHQRTNGTFYHIVDYDDNGNVIFKGFNMGVTLDPEETWARGQGWALYGYTMCYRYTKDQKYLTAAEKLATYLIDNLPSDHIPYFMINYPANTNRDASAGAIMFSGLVELYNTTRHAKYLTLAENILSSLSSTTYLTKDKSYYSVICKATENYTDTEKGLIYADYYLIEGLTRYLKLREDTVLATGTACAHKRNKASDVATYPVQANSSLCQIYPNPAVKSVNIKMNMPAVVKITDITGKVQVVKNIEAGTTEIPLNLSKGIYFIQAFVENNNIITNKLIVE